MERSLKPLKFYPSLATRKGRLEAGAFLVEGERAVHQIVESRAEAVMEIVTIEGTAPPRPRFPIREVTESQFKSISQATTPQGVLAVVRSPEGIYSAALPPDPGSRVLLLEDIQDPGNTGTLIRTAATLGFSGVVLTDKCADPLSPRAVQAAAGTVLSIWLRRTGGYLGMVNELKRRAYWVVAADLEGEEDEDAFKGQERIVLALGNEASGLSDSVLALADRLLKLPTTRGKAESLNVAACGAILMFLATRPPTGGP